MAEGMLFDSKKRQPLCQALISLLDVIIGKVGFGISIRGGLLKVVYHNFLLISARFIQINASFRLLSTLIDIHSFMHHFSQSIYLSIYRYIYAYAYELRT